MSTHIEHGTHLRAKTNPLSSPALFLWFGYNHPFCEAPCLVSAMTVLAEITERSHNAKEKEGGCYADLKP